VTYTKNDDDVFLSVPSESQPTVNEIKMTQLDLQSTTSDLTMVDQTTSDANCPSYVNWDYPTCRYVNGVYSENAMEGYSQPVNQSAVLMPTLASSATHYADLMPCNVQQRLVCGTAGGVVQYHSTGGAVFNSYDAVQQRALSDISGTSPVRLLTHETFVAVFCCATLLLDFRYM